MMLRKQQGWSQEELAARLGISRQSVSKWESAMAIPDLDKILKLSSLFSVSTDFLLKDEMEFPESFEAQIAAAEETEDPANVRPMRTISIEEANAYMELSNRVANRIAFAVMLAILSPVCLILLGGLAEYGHLLSENAAGGMGVLILLILVACAVAILIPNGLALSKYEYIEKETFSLHYGVKGIVEQKKDSYETHFRTHITLGTTLCILGVAPMFIAVIFDSSDMIYVICTSLILVFVAIGVFLFVSVGIPYGTYQKLLQTDDYTPQNKELGRRTSAFPGAYWCTVTAIYLGISFYTMQWDRTWIIWPVAGVLFAALYGIIKSIAQAKRPKSM